MKRSPAAAAAAAATPKLGLVEKWQTALKAVGYSCTEDFHLSLKENKCCEGEERSGEACALVNHAAPEVQEEMRARGDLGADVLGPMLFSAWVTGVDDFLDLHNEAVAALNGNPRPSNKKLQLESFGKTRLYSCLGGAIWSADVEPSWFDEAVWSAGVDDPLWNPVRTMFQEMVVDIKPPWSEESARKHIIDKVIRLAAPNVIEARVADAPVGRFRIRREHPLQFTQPGGTIPEMSGRLDYALLRRDCTSNGVTTDLLRGIIEAKKYITAEVLVASEAQLYCYCQFALANFTFSPGNSHEYDVCWGVLTDGVKWIFTLTDTNGSHAVYDIIDLGDAEMDEKEMLKRGVLLARLLCRLLNDPDVVRDAVERLVLPRDDDEEEEDHSENEDDVMDEFDEDEGDAEDVEMDGT